MSLPPGAIGTAGVMVSDVGDMQRWVEACVRGTTNSAATQARRLDCVTTGIAGVRFGLGILRHITKVMYRTTVAYPG